MPMTQRGNLTWLQKMRRMNRGRAPRPPRTKTDTYRAANAEIAIEIENWWKKRLQEGIVFGATADTVEPLVDYRGDMPWPKYVSLHALHVDFQASTGVSVARYFFSGVFRKLNNKPKSKTFNYSVKDRDGQALLFRTRTYYDLSKAETTTIDTEDGAV